jgi:mannose-6-phosphate isomerase
MIYLYPFKFNSIYKEKIWGGEKIKTILNKDISQNIKCGESWEISSVDDNISVVKDGKLAGYELNQLISEYKEDLVGENVYKQFGSVFPLLIKFLDANEDLSIQVHPNDEIAKRKYNTGGKTEMWYVIEADENAKINVGFNRDINKYQYLDNLNSGTLLDILNYETVKSGDVYFLPAGRIHYIGKGCLIAEIQQTSDITYRIYDFDRIDNLGNKRELHTDDALECLDFNTESDYKTHYNKDINKPASLISCDYFKTNFINLYGELSRNYTNIDSFIIYVIVEGTLEVKTQNYSVYASLGECILIPACLKNIIVSSEHGAKLIEVWIG